jgi:signal transduction histidine kinase
MQNIILKRAAGLLLLTVLLLVLWTQFVLRETNTDAITGNESKLRLKLSDSIGFMKTNWEDLEALHIKKELEQRLAASEVEAAIFDNKTQSVIFVYGEYAQKASMAGNEEVFGLSQQEDFAKGERRQLTWLVYKHNILLGAVKFYIPNKNETAFFDSMKLGVCLSGVGVFLVLLLLWICFLGWRLRSKQKLLSSLNKSVIDLARGKWDDPIVYIEAGEEMGESFMMLDRTRQDLKDMLLAKEEYEASRKILVNYLMHDIRTPVASMRVLTEGLIDGIPRTEDAKRTYYEGIQKKISELEKLTDDLFHHVNIEAGALLVQPEEVYCDEAMLPVLSGINAITFKGSMEIDYKIPHVLVKMDTGRMEQALINLITNAVKYSKENGFIRLNIIKEESMVVFQVEDDGHGISKEDLPFIFEHFFRGEKSRSRQFGGTGLGLSIVKYIIEAHGGYITVKSQLEEGSLFKIHLPLI